MPQYILSDPKLMKLIKKQQYKDQVPSLALLVIAFLLAYMLPNFNMHYPSLTIAVLAMIWYMYVGACYRVKQRIPAIKTDNLLSPVTGRVRYVKTASDNSQLSISKSAIDLVEIRSPHNDCLWEGETLKLNYNGINLTFRFEANKLIRFDTENMDAGRVIGMLVGKGACYLSLPNTLKMDLQQKELCEAGLTSILAETT